MQLGIQWGLTFYDGDGRVLGNKVEKRTVISMEENRISSALSKFGWEAAIPCTCSYTSSISVPTLTLCTCCAIQLYFCTCCHHSYHSVSAVQYLLQFCTCCHASYHSVPATVHLFPLCICCHTTYRNCCCCWSSLSMIAVEQKKTKSSWTLLGWNQRPWCWYPRALPTEPRAQQRSWYTSCSIWVERKKKKNGRKGALCWAWTSIPGVGTPELS